MGRSKPTPKRRRVNDEATQLQAIEALRSAPQDAVEAAAASAVRADVVTWDRICHSIASSSDETHHEFSGLGRCRLDSDDFLPFRQLHNTIQRKASSQTSWSGSKTDPRRRSFGFLPRTLGYDPDVRSKLDISAPDATVEAAAKERVVNERAVAHLDEADVPLTFAPALERLLAKLRPSAPHAVRTYLTLSNLIAAQPNLHGGRHLLPAHVDHPLKDGFGIVIVTVAIRGSALILLETCDRKSRGCFPLGEGDAYMLSGNVRDGCTHGVLADEGCGERESLNLRFGLHNDGSGDDDGSAAPSAEDVLKHWT